MNDRLQHHVSARLESDELTGDELQILSVVGTERISQLFEFDIHCVGAIGAAIPVAGEDLLNKAASLVFYQGDVELRRIEGMVCRAREHAEQGMDRPHVIVTFVPRAYVASQFETLDVFLDTAVPGIVEQVLGQSRLTAGSDFDIEDLVSRSASSEEENGSKDYPCVEYTVQYKESNLAFVQRICEHLGIFYFFDSEGMMIFGDSNGVFQQLERTPEVSYLPQDMGTWTDRVCTLELVTKNLPARYIMRDYNWRNPGVDMMGEAEVIPDGVGQIVEYGGHFKSPEQGNGMAEIRAQELRATRYVYEGTSTVPSFTAGGTFMLAGHAFGDMDLVLIEVVHEFTSDKDGNTGTYRNSFRAISRETPYRPPRLTPKPRVDGALTGIVQGGSGTEFGELDDQGRYRVKFMFDTAERGEAQASRAVRMAQPSAGGSQGFSFPLRAGVEVILTCIDGDPDRPIITGAVPNPSQPSPTTGDNPNHNMIRTSKNQIDIDDDEPRIKLTTDGHGAELQLGTPNEPNEGYILKTISDGVGSAGKLMGSSSKLVSDLAEIRQSTANKNIYSIAGSPNPLKLGEQFMSFASATVDFASGALGAADSALSFAKNLGEMNADATKQKVAAAKDKVITDTLGDTPENKYDKNNATRPVTTEDGGTVYVTETEEDFRKRKYAEAMEARKAAGITAAANNDPEAEALLADPPPVGDELPPYIPFFDTSSEVEAAQKNEGYNKVKSVVGTAKSITDGYKKLKELKKALKKGGALWGTAFRLHSMAQENKELAGAWKTRAQYNAVTGNTERKPHKGAFAAPPYHILGASNTTYLYGKVNTYVASRSTAIYGSRGVGVKSARLVQISSKNNLELATKNLYISVAENSNTKVAGRLGTRVTKVAQYIYDDILRTIATNNVHLHSKESKIEVKAKTGFFLDGGTKIDGKAEQVKLASTSKSVVIDAKADFWTKAKADAKINADKAALVHGRSKFTGKSDEGGIEATTSKTKIWQQSSQINMKSSSINAKSSNVELSGSSKVLVKGGGITIQLGSGKAKIG